MVNYRLISVFPILLFCVACSFAKSEPVESQDSTNLLNGYSCDADGVTWIKQEQDQWLSSTGISVTLYHEESFDAVASASFWDSDNSSEADSILEAADPGKEIDVTQLFRRVGDPWRINEIQPECPPDADCMPSPYVIHYLHRPENDWVIDHLMTRAQGVVTSKPDPQAPLSRDIYFALNGPYQPIFEGRFTHDEATFWFSAREVEANQEISIPEMRFTTLQQLNDLVKSCLLGSR